MKLSDFVVDFLARQGVKHVFFLPGGGAMHLNDSLGASADLEPVCVLHEQAAAVAAEAAAKVTGRLGAAMVTTGPGGTNTVTGVAGAWLDSSPVVFISGQVKRPDLKGQSGLRNRGVQEIDIVSIVQPITKYAVTVMEPDTIRYHLEKAAYLATSGRPGPIWIDIPLDVQASQVDPDTVPGFSSPSPVVDEYGILREQVAEVVAALRSSERPFLLLGNGIRLAGGMREMQEVLDRVAVPFGLTWLSMDFAPEDHPLLVGRPGPLASRAANFALQNADFLLAVGARLDLATTAYAPERLARGAKKFLVDIDSAEIEKLQPYLTAGICADARLFLQEMLRQLSSGHVAPDDWRQRCAAWKAKYPLSAPGPDVVDGPVSVYRFTQAMSRALPEGALVVPGSSGNAIEIFLLMFSVKRGQRVLHTAGLGSMGFGIPASIGACLASGRATTVCLEGDGGFQMNAQELQTIARLKLPIKIFVVVNDGYGSIFSSQSAYFGRLVGCTPESGLTFPDTEQLAAAYGLPARKIQNTECLEEEIRATFDCEGPCVCEVRAPLQELRQPRVASHQTSDGRMVSRPLEDLFPFLPRDEFLANMLIPPIAQDGA